MKNVTVSIVHMFVSVLACWCVPLHAHTLAETNEVVSALLSASSPHLDNFSESTSWSFVDTRNPFQFFNLIEDADGWTYDGRRAAFDEFLEAMWKFDFNDETLQYRGLSTKAVAQCAFMNYTNALPAMKKLIVNETYPHRARIKAIKSLVPMMPLDVEGSCYVESIFTNTTKFTIAERGVICGMYVDRIVSSQTNGQYNVSVFADAVQRFYGHRKRDSAGSVILDELFVAGISGYSASSNRLDYAMFMLSHKDCNKLEEEKFSVITNQLLSSGQPLRWINVGGTNP